MTSKTRRITRITAGTHFSNGDSSFVAATKPEADHADRQRILMAVRVVHADGTLSQEPTLYSADKTQVVEVLPAYVAPPTAL